jgi:hypothetical protein
LSSRWRLASVEQSDRACLRTHGALVRRPGHLHDHAYFELVEVAACHGVAREIQLGRVVDLDESVALICKQPDHHSTLRGGLGALDVMDLHPGNFLKLPLHGSECIVERSGMIGLRLVPLLDVLAKDRVVPRHVNLNSDAQGNFCAVCASMGYFHEDPAPRNAPLQALQRIDALPDKGLKSRGAFGTFERDLERLLQNSSP